MGNEALLTTLPKITVLGDYDGCFHPLFDTEGNVKWEETRALFGKFHEIAFGTTDEVMALWKFASFSRRQSPRIDHYNNNTNNNGLSFVNYPKLCERLEMAFDPITLCDIYHQQKSGYSVENIENKSSLHCPSAENKMTLSYMHIHRAACSAVNLPGREDISKKIILIVDDHEEILLDVHNFYNTYKTLIPEGITVKFIHYQPRKNQDPIPIGEISGNGIIDVNYLNTVRLLLKAVDPDLLSIELGNESAYCNSDELELLRLLLTDIMRSTKVGETENIDNISKITKDLFQNFLLPIHRNMQKIRNFTFHDSRKDCVDELKRKYKGHFKNFYQKIVNAIKSGNSNSFEEAQNEFKAAIIGELGIFKNNVKIHRYPKLKKIVDAIQSIIFTIPIVGWAIWSMKCISDTIQWKGSTSPYFGGLFRAGNRTCLFKTTSEIFAIRAEERISQSSIIQHAAFNKSAK